MRGRVSASRSTLGGLAPSRLRLGQELRLHRRPAGGQRVAAAPREARLPSASSDSPIAERPTAQAARLRILEQCHLAPHVHSGWPLQNQGSYQQDKGVGVFDLLSLLFLL